MSNVGVARAYSVFFWINALLWTAIIAVLTAGLGMFLLPFLAWYKWRVINRTKIVFEQDTNRIKFQRGRWFVLDDDIIPVKSIDNVKLNRSVLGRIFGWCDIDAATRVERYRIRHVSTRSAEAFRLAFLAQA